MRKDVMALLDDPDKQSEVVHHLVHGCTITGAAQAAGIGRNTIARYAKLHPEFAERLRAARDRRTQLADGVVRVAPEVAPQTVDAVVVPAGVPVAAIIGDAASIPGLCSMEDYCELLLMHAEDSTSKGCAKALGILGELLVGPVARAQQRAESSGHAPPVIDDAIRTLLDLAQRGGQSTGPSGSG